MEPRGQKLSSEPGAERASLILREERKCGGSKAGETVGETLVFLRDQRRRNNEKSQERVQLSEETIC